MLGWKKGGKLLGSLSHDYRVTDLFGFESYKLKFMMGIEIDGRIF